MSKINEKYKNAINAIIAVTLYFIWPSLTKYFVNMLNGQVNELYTFISNIILLIILFIIYHKNILSSLKKISLRRILYLFGIIVVVQMITNLLSVALIGVKNHNTYGGLLPDFLKNYPVLAIMSLVIIFPIVESITFNKTLRDIINSKWAFIICSSLFFWLVNLLAFDFRFVSIIATMSCFTTSIVINYFYYKDNNISSVIMVKMIYNLIFLLLP
ncbi:MAG: CPBP family intramembrane metalloprotease [Bacilli bacterium]|nr:CPBP family intramembrane metalloprotease [Bacilli bacterium]